MQLVKTPMITHIFSTDDFAGAEGYRLTYPDELHIIQLSNVMKDYQSYLQVLDFFIEDLTLLFNASTSTLATAKTIQNT